MTSNKEQQGKDLQAIVAQDIYRCFKMDWEYSWKNEHGSSKNFTQSRMRLF